MTDPSQTDKARTRNRAQGTRARWCAPGWRWPTGASAGFPIPWCLPSSASSWCFVTGLLLRESPSKLAIAGGKSFWSLVPFTMQMVMIIIGGYVVASTPLVYRAIRWLAGVPKTPRGAIATGGAVLHADVADLLGTEPDLQRPLRARAIATREGPGLSRCRSRGISRSGSSVGHGTVLVGCHADGDQVGDSAFAVRDQRT